MDYICINKFNVKIPQNNRLFLKDIHLEGYKSIKDLTTDVSKSLNIIIGKNGAGKSNFLQALGEGIGGMYYDRIPFQQASFTFLGLKDELVRLELSRLQGGVINAAIDFGVILSVDVKFYLDNMLVYDNVMTEPSELGVTYYRTLREAINKSGIRYWQQPVFIQYELPSKLELIDMPGAMNIPYEVGAGSWTVPSGTEFVNELVMTFATHNDIRSVDRKTIDKEFMLTRMVIDEILLDNLQKFTPIQDVRINDNINVYYTDESTIVENIKLDFFVGDNWLPWSQLSDGTRRLFYIMSEVMANEGNLILIEEPELGIHPRQFDALMTFLKEQSKYSQIIMSTHSPTALNHLDENELDKVLIAEYSKKVGTQFRRMSDEQLEKAKVYMNEVGSLSDYWLLSDLEE